MDREERILTALRYIEERLPRTADLKEIADRANMSPYHFHREFKKIVGESVGKYCQIRRLTMAAIRLIRTDDKICEIAMLHGYECQATFSRAFKELYDLSPKDFRRLLTEISVLSPDPLTIENVLAQRKVLKYPSMVVKGRFKVTDFLGIHKRVVSEEENDDFFLHDGNIDCVAESSVNYGFVRKAIPPHKESPKFVVFVGVKEENVEKIVDGLFITDICKQKYILFFPKKILKDLKETYDHVYGILLPQSDLFFCSEDCFIEPDEEEKKLLDLKLIFDI